MSKTPKIWTVFEAARYVDGKKQESLDARFDSSGKHRMVRLEDYQDLEQQLALVKESQQKWFDAYIAQVDETKKAEAEIAALRKDVEEIARMAGWVGVSDPLPFLKRWFARMVKLRLIKGEQKPTSTWQA